MPDLALLQPVEYLVIGHVTEDRTPAGLRIGGTAAYAALTASALGLQVGIVTAAGEATSLEPLSRIQVVNIPSTYSTAFENMDTPSGRLQILHHQAARIPYGKVPEVWRKAPIIHLGPVAQEIESPWPVDFSPSLLGLTPQGWMRTWNGDGRVQPSNWEGAEAWLARAGAVVISREDVGGDEERIEEMARQTRILAVTEGAAGSVLYWNGDRRRFPAPKVAAVDATGAGDIYAAAFLIRFTSTHDPWEAARFATQLAARSVSRPGLEGIPTRTEIDECLVEVF